MTTETNRNQVRVPEGLWTDLQCAFVYYLDTPDQRTVAASIRAALARNDPAGALDQLAATESVAGRIRELLETRRLPNWAEGVGEVLAELAREMERESARRAPVVLPADLEAGLRRTIASLDFCRPDDLLEVAPGPATWVNWVSLHLSPDWRPEKGEWDRDTQFMFEMHFDKGLFLWLSANTHPAFRGQSIGTRFFRACETYAAGCGLRRFSVLGPNNGSYWSKALGYASCGTRLITNMEGYKELPAPSV